MERSKTMSALWCAAFDQSCNPLIIKEMAKTASDAASYAPVTILVDERADGVHLSYDSMASLLAPYGSQSAFTVAMDLDAKVESLLETAAR